MKRKKAKSQERGKGENKSLSVLVKDCKIKKSGNNTGVSPANLPNFRDW